MVNLRSSAIPYRKSYQKMALRILPRNTSVDQIHNLGMAEKNLGLMRRAITRRQGLIIVTGPTGEGKTTTLYACLREINKDNINIQTIEDPIERTIEGLNQTEVDNARGVTFAQLMRTMVRQDPNVILLGEIRDKESADLAIEASLTGHLVFATLHANSAVKAILRLKQLGTPPYLLADSLILLQTQRLLKTLCNKCKVAAALSIIIRSLRLLLCISQKAAVNVYRRVTVAVVQSWRWFPSMTRCRRPLWLKKAISKFGNWPTKKVTTLFSVTL